MRLNRKQPTALYHYRLRYFFLLIIILGTGKSVQAQCPPNLDFEQGDFTGWQCYIGSFSGGNLILNPSPPTANRHEMLSAVPGNGVDLYGNFPQNCPNGSSHSIRLGNAQGGGQAERVSYTFTIPPLQNQFSLIYHYAVVLNDFGHPANIQPRLTIEVRNLTDNTIDPCSSFDFVINNTLPGFFTSAIPGPGNTPVRCKDWSAASINLDGNAGKTIQISFTTTDCGQTAHFGYAYIDVNTECSSSFVGATYCPDDSFINVTAPFGYQTYAWWDISFTTLLGNTQTINFTPPPPPGTQIAVVIEPYSGYGCKDTLYAELLDTLTIQSQAGPDQLSCNNTPVQLGVNPRVGYVYSWSPVTGLSNPTISNPIATPSVTTQYVVTTSHEGGGCISTDTVIVSAAVLDTTLTVTGPVTGCIVGTQPTTLEVMPADSIQWYLNNVAIPGANQTLYNVLQGGSYYATVFSFTGCTLSTSVIFINVNPAPTIGFTISTANQCFANNQFTFTNTSSVVTGTLQYDWDLGDGTTATTTDVIHSYILPGNYTVKLIVTTDMGCIDSISFPVKVYASPVAGFTVNTNDQCIKDNQFVFTNTTTLSSGSLQYTWNLGDGNTTTTKDVTHIYTLPGTYTVKLLVVSDNGCADSSSFDVSVNASPVAGFTVANAQQCFTNNQFDYINTTVLPTGTLQYLWSLGDGTTAITRDVTHSYLQPGDYTVKMVATSDKGCADSSSFNVKIYPFATADFYVEPICVNLILPLTNKTINNTSSALNYNWDFGNGQNSTARTPVYSYPAPGRYTISLSVNTTQCPLPLTVKKLDVLIDAPVPGIRYTDKDAVMNFPEPLQARNIGASAFWNPGINLDNRYIYKPSFKGLNPQLYTIQLKTLSGCLTVDTQIVKTHKKIEIYVPTVFTPGNGDGLNDYLRPLLMGFTKVNYFRLYNRWGKLIFQMQSDRPGWDGRINGQLQEMQTVVWMIEAVDVDGVVHTKQGTTVLLR